MTRTRLFPVAPTIPPEELDAALHPLLDLGEDLGMDLWGGGRSLNMRRAGAIPVSRFELREDGRALQYWTVRTSSHDFGGERTDIHDVISTSLAILLANAAGLGSRLVDEVNWFSGVPGELYARLIVPGQPTGALVAIDGDLEEVAGRLVWTLWLNDRLWECLHDPETCVHSDQQVTEQDEEWEVTARDALGLGADVDCFSSRRNFPAWHYFRVVRSGAMLLRAEPLVRMLQVLRSPPDLPAELTTREGRFLQAPGRRNVIPPGVARRARRALKRLGDLGRAEQPTWVVLEDRVVGLAGRHMIVLPARCDGRAHDHLQQRVQQRLERERGFFSGDQRFEWADPVDPQRFEDLIAELLWADGDVLRIRPVGSINEPDRERDQVADWFVPTGSISKGEVPGNAMRVVVQCKARRGSLGRAELPAVLDLLVEHDAEGFFLAVSSQLSASAFDRMERLRDSSDKFVDWWGRLQIEQALRRSPSVAARYMDVVAPTV